MVTTKNTDELIKLINQCQKDYKIRVKVVPNSKQNSIEFLPTEDYIKIKISKPAVDGKANKELIGFLSKLLDVPKSYISILNGENSSLKCLLIKPKGHIIRAI